MTARKLILASGSPRRQELLQHITKDFSVIVSDADEDFDPALSPAFAVQEIAKHKAQAVFVSHQDAVVIGADTIVVTQNQILGKPKDKETAKNMLHQLSGKTHTVYTGVCILTKEQTICFACETAVVFATLSDEEIEAYIQTNEPFDKAGGYGIQGYGSKFIKEIRGDFFNVMGFPVNAIYEELKKL